MPLILSHLLIAFAHGYDHDAGHVGLSRAACTFVLAVIVMGPVIGLAIAFALPRAGAAVVAATMGSALVFGLINHFIIVGADHASQVAVEWRPLFTATAWLLMASEAATAALGLRLAVGRREDVS